MWLRLYQYIGDIYVHQPSYRWYVVITSVIFRLVFEVFSVLPNKTKSLALMNLVYGHFNDNSNSAMLLYNL